MLTTPRIRARRAARTSKDVLRGDSVARTGGFVPTAEGVVVALGLARSVLGVAFLAAPAVSVRVLGMETATAKRVTYLARMAAARDIGLGAGLLAAGPGPSSVPWLVASAAADTVDALAIAGALRTGAARGVTAAGVVIGATASAAAGFWAASRLRSR